MRECTDRKDRRLKREKQREKQKRWHWMAREEKERREVIRIERQGRGERGELRGW